MNPYILRYMVPHLILAAILVIAGITLVQRTQRGLQGARAEYAQQLEQAKRSRDLHATTARDEQVIRATIQRFNTLRQQGLIGSEDRLAWSEFMRRIEETRRLPRMIYEMLPQRMLRRFDANGDFSLQTSRMRLDLGLLHEGDLLRVLDDLALREDTLIVPRNCLLQRIPNTAGRINAPTVDARCELDWITIRPPGSMAAQARRP